MESSLPALPLDLERHIFEITALSRPVLIPRLMLVAWRVKEWAEPLLYRTITTSDASRIVHDENYPLLTSAAMLLALEKKPATFFRDAVRNLYLIVADAKDLGHDTS
ncbi:hypothetical protein FB451DRAFT_1405047 [Mycena latifolia]|nr:hypothetical protein FB451DRAFT_1405047 [Mycena latifolia]